MQQSVDLGTVEVEYDPAHPVVTQGAQTVHAAIGAHPERGLAGVSRIKDRVLSTPPHHRGAFIQVGCGAREPVSVVVNGALFGLCRHSGPGLGQHHAALYKGEYLVEVGVVVTELFHGAFGAGVQGIEAALSKRDVK